MNKTGCVIESARQLSRYTSCKDPKYTVSTGVSRAALKLNKVAVTIEAQPRHCSRFTAMFFVVAVLA